MVKVNLGGCSSFVKDADYKSYVEKALSALDVLEAGTGAGNDFLGWKYLPTETPESLVEECEQIRDAWCKLCPRSSFAFICKQPQGREEGSSAGFCWT